MKLCLSTFILIHLIHIGAALSIKCKYSQQSFDGEATYICNLENDLSTSSTQTAQIDGTTGIHMSRKTNDDVTAIYGWYRSVYNFPKGLDKVFKNLKIIFLNNCELKAIKQSDLRPFPKLTYLNLNNNDIQVLEENLFQYNQDLKVILLSYNKITKIHPKIFDGLPELTHLKLNGNTCIDMEAFNSSPAIEDIQKQIKITCK